MKLALIFLLLSFSIFANQVSYNYDFDDPVIDSKNGIQSIHINGLPTSIEANKPILPFKMAKILLPQSVTLKEVKAVRSEVTKLRGIHSLHISKGSSPYGANSQLPQKSYHDLTLTENYPKIISYNSSQLYHGYKILLVKIHPVFITPDKSVYFSKNIEIQIEVDFIKQESFGNVKNLTKNYKTVANLVDNPQELSTYDLRSLPFENTEQDYDYLIIADPKILSSRGKNPLDDFKKFLEEEKGLKVKVTDVKTAISSQDGTDDAQKLRHYLREEYNNYGVKYLLIAGDSDGWRPVIPFRKLYSSVRGYLNGSWKTVTKQIPSDFYYSCLDGTFNSNGNTLWGELDDGPDGKDVDFLCELTVGRWSVDNATELKMMVDKTIKIHQTLKSRNKNTLMVGELLFQELDSWGADYMDKLIGEVRDHDFTSIGYNNEWSISKLYDKEKRWGSSSLTKLIDEGDFLMINHVGHSNTSYNMKLNSRRLPHFKNDNPFFLYTQGCYPGNYTADASIIELMLIRKNGPFAAIANTVYGLGPEDPDPDSTSTPGTSQILHRHFINNVLNPKLYLNFGMAHQKSKEDILEYINHQEARWVTWSTTYFGDPVIKD